MQVVETKVEDRQVEDTKKAVDGSLQSVRNHNISFVLFPAFLSSFAIDCHAGE
jgi:hypothetical protein